MHAAMLNVSCYSCVLATYTGCYAAMKTDRVILYLLNDRSHELLKRNSPLLKVNFMLSDVPQLNPLTMNDNYSCHQNSAAFYQLAQSVLKIGSALAKRVGQRRWVGVPLWVTAHGGCCR